MEFFALAILAGAFGVDRAQTHWLKREAAQAELVYIKSIQQALALESGNRSPVAES